MSEIIKTTRAREEWRDIPGFEDCYQVSNLGRVRSKDRIVRHNCGGDKKVRGKVLAQLKTPNGYKQVFLWREGKRKVWLVHRLVLLSFIGPCPDNMEVRHLNSISTDNRLCNLSYGTHSENTIDTLNLGRGGKQRLNPKSVIEIRERLDAGEPTIALAHEYGVSARAIYKVKNRSTYSWLWG